MLPKEQHLRLFTARLLLSHIQLPFFLRDPTQLSLVTHIQTMA